MYANTRSAQRKINGKWIKTYHDSTNDVFVSLAHELHARYIMKVTYITRVTDRNNYDGTRTIIIYYNNDFRNVYTIR